MIDKIDVLRMIRVDFNVNPGRDMGYHSLLQSWIHLRMSERNANHPEHVAVSKGIIGPVKADRACVDYEY